MTNQQEEVELRKNLENIIIADDYVHGVQYKTLDNLVQFIEAHTNKAIGEVLDRLESLNGSHPDSYIATFIEDERKRLKGGE